MNIIEFLSHFIPEQYVAAYAALSPEIRGWVNLSALAALAVTARFVAQWLLLHFVPLVSARVRSGWAAIVLHDHVLVRVAKIAPSVVMQLGIHWVQDLHETPARAIANMAAAFTTWHMMRAITCVFDEMGAAHDRHDGPKLTQTNSIKSYVQLGKLLAWIIGGVLIAASIMDKSPLLLLSGMGAMSAVLMLVFKDTILSFVAGVQIATNDMLRVGDWIEMPQTGADGAVVEIGLNTVKVQNWDKTITTIPTWRLMSDSFKNWRGMFDSGGRRIMRSLYIDASTVRLLSEQQNANMQDIALLDGWWDARQGLLARPDLAAQNIPVQAIAADQVTNLSVFKAYVKAYLLAHPRIHHGTGMLLLVRTLEPTALGVPLQIYAFTNTTAWVEYESIQGEIFEHLIGILPSFGLALYQRSSDRVELALSQHGQR